MRSRKWDNAERKIGGEDRVNGRDVCIGGDGARECSVARTARHKMARACWRLSDGCSGG